MRAVDDRILELLRAVLPPARENPGGPLQPRVHDGLVVVDNATKMVTYPLPFATYVSNVGLDDNPRLAGRHVRRSVFFSIRYVGEDRAQAKWAGERIRDQLNDRRVTVPGYSKTWRIKLVDSQRVRRDDDAIRPDGSPLFSGIDEYDLALMNTRVPALVEVAP